MDGAGINDPGQEFSTDAILLRKIEYGDHDYIITFLTRTMGKISVIAKNAKKSVRRFSGALDMFSLNHIQCRYPKKNKNGLIILTQSGIENGFIQIRYDLFKTAYASYWVELIYSWLEEGRVQTRLFELLLFSLDMLDRSAVDPGILNLLYQIRFMGISGFSPVIDRCESCDRRLDAIAQDRIRFDLKDGKLICDACLKPDTGTRDMGGLSDKGHFLYISKGTLKQLAWMNASDMARADRIKFSSFAMTEGAALMEAFIPFHIGREMKTLKFLHRLRQEQ